MKNNKKSYFRYKSEGEDSLLKAMSNAGMTMEELHRNYCEIYNSEVPFDSFKAAILTPYTNSEYHLAQRVEDMLEIWMDYVEES